MSELERRLESLGPDVILDLACGRGDSTAWVQSLFDDPGIPVVCVDVADRGFRSGVEALSTPRVLPLVSDAGSMAVRSGSVGLVSVFNSLHHFPRPEEAVGEVRRIAGPGGAVLIAEMHRGVRTEAQVTHMLLHHWWAASDRLMGVSHGETFTDIELRRLAEGLGASELLVEEQETEAKDPFNGEVRERLEAACDSYLERLAGQPGADGLIVHGLRLRARIAEKGFSPAPRLVILAVI